MRLKPHQQNIDEKIWEFDVWVTPSIVDIRATPRFQSEMQCVLEVLGALTLGGHQLLDPLRFAADLVDRVFLHLDNNFCGGGDFDSISAQASSFLKSTSALLFLVTGKSDNNNKCQFPIYLRNIVQWNSLPRISGGKLKKQVTLDDIPRVLDSEGYMGRIACLYAAGKAYQWPSFAEHPKELAASLLYQFTNSLLADPPSRAQLSAFLDHYDQTQQRNEDPSLLLAPLVAFQVRGSVAASGGHEPEELLRTRMSEWGLVRGRDFNETDVILDAGIYRAAWMLEPLAVEPIAQKDKTRAYDFVLPFQTPNWTPRIFIQAQFYAGDAGSVSHKNVDQTRDSRAKATTWLKSNFPNSPPPRFVEFVDGAGYCASLNRDLRSILFYTDTFSFFQLRSAPIRLRRELQDIGFLAPLEIAHASLMCRGDLMQIDSYLRSEGYSPSEVERATRDGVSSGLLVSQAQNSLTVSSANQPMVQQYLLLDLIARLGKSFNSMIGLAGVVLVPGYGPYYGVSISDLAQYISAYLPYIWGGAGFMFDLQQLCQNGFVILR